ncbi:MAG: exopolyphosphatase, partial [Bacteroidetes bacterium CG23_combo_of_CG06-09_8_20_14_all_32_9]
MRIAAIDLGTNTFNLLVADADAKNFREIYRDKKAVKLGQHGITQHKIPDDAIVRGISAIKEYI